MDRGSCYPPASLSSSAMASFPGFPSDSVGKLMQLGVAKLSLLSHFSTPSCLLGALVSRSSTSRLPCRYLFPLAAPESPSSHRQSPLGAIESLSSHCLSLLGALESLSSRQLNHQINLLRQPHHHQHDHQINCMGLTRSRLALPHLVLPRLHQRSLRRLVHFLLIHAQLSYLTITATFVTELRCRCFPRGRPLELFFLGLLCCRPQGWPQNNFFLDSVVNVVIFFLLLRARLPGPLRLTLVWYFLFWEKVLFLV